MAKATTTWRVELRPPATDTDEETTRRVRAFLKCALRSFQLTAITAIKVEAKPAEGASGE
jgi:5,10-methylenetetrahydrofolate reductase